jgi:hypothetical protein
MFPAIAATHEGVRLRKDRVPTTRNATFPAVSAKDRAAHCRRDGLRRADRTRVHVGATAGVVVGVHVPNVLSVALHHLEDFGSDLDELTATLLRSPAAALAHRESDLVARAPGFPIAVEGLPAEQQEGCVFVERLACIPTDFRHRFAEGREDLA